MGLDNVYTLEGSGFRGFMVWTLVSELRALFFQVPFRVL